MTPLRFASWAAVSTLPQAKKISIEDQLATNREHIARHGGQVVAELVIPGESRSIVLFEDACRRIEAYAHLKEMIDQRAFDVLIYLDRSRLGRKASLSMAVVELCAEAGIATYETENPPATITVASSHDDMLLGAIKSVGAQREIQKLQERHRMGMLGRVQKGDVPSHLVYGYVSRFDAAGGRTIHIDEDAAAVVRQVFAWYLDGAGAPGIAARMTAQGKPSPTGKPAWTTIMAANIIDKVWRYAGYSEINRVSPNRPYLRAKGNWTPIIDETTLEKVLTEHAARRANHKLADTPHMLSGVSYCRHCGHAMVVNRQVYRTRGNYTWLQIRCLRHRPGEYIGYDRVMTTLRAELEAMAHADLDALLEDAGDPVDAITAQIAQHDAVTARLQTAMRRADDAYVAGIMDAERYRHQVERLKAQVAHEEAEIAHLRALIVAERQRGSRRQRLEEVAHDGRRMLEHPDVTLANAWLRTHVRVWVDKNAVISVEWL